MVSKQKLKVLGFSEGVELPVGGEEFC